MPTKPRPRPWLTLDAEYLNQDTIATLRDEFGADGPLTFLAIIFEAKKADLGGARPAAEQGILSIRTNALARLVGASQGTVASIVRRSVELGLLEVLDGTDEAAGRLVVRSLKREAWEPKDATAAARQARKRQRDGGGEGVAERSDDIPF